MFFGESVVGFKEIDTFSFSCISQRRRSATQLDWCNFEFLNFLLELETSWLRFSRWSYERNNRDLDKCPAPVLKGLKFHICLALREANKDCTMKQSSESSSVSRVFSNTEVRFLVSVEGRVFDNFVALIVAILFLFLNTGISWFSWFFIGECCWHHSFYLHSYRIIGMFATFPEVFVRKSCAYWCLWRDTRIRQFWCIATHLMRRSSAMQHVEIRSRPGSFQNWSCRRLARCLCD